MTPEPSEEKMLIALRAWSHWYRIVTSKPKYYPGLSLLKKGFESALKSLKSESRKTVLRLARLGKCISCGAKVGEGAGDHIIPVSKGGPQSAENFMPLCRKCNSSKGNKDLLEWWIGQGRNIKDLNQDALTIYLRLRYRLRHKIQAPIEPLRKAIEQAKETLPNELLDYFTNRLRNT